MSAQVRSIFNAAGGNRHPAAADWSGDLLAFGADRNIALWRPLSPKHEGIHALLHGHADTVNVVKFLPPSIILSGSADKTVMVSIPDATSPTGYVKSQVLADHKSSINTIAVDEESNVFVTGSADAELKLWNYEWNEAVSNLTITLTQTIQLAPKYFPLATALISLQDCDSQILAVAGTKAVIQIYVSENGQFRLVASLTGHEGWIRSLAFVYEPDTKDILLASASQDKYVRLWRVHPGKDLPAINSAVDPALGSIGKSLANKAHRFETQSESYSVTFEALLIGHEDWIFTVKWHTSNKQLSLLSSSADSSLAIWESDPSSGVWLSSVRLGEISSQKGATTATGSAGGYWIGLWSPSGEEVVSLGRTGSWRIWKHNKEDDRWAQDVAVTGHTRAVRDLTWSRDGSYLLTTSSDQTTRLFSQWKKPDQTSWHEFSRPQIHGYDLNCISTINNAEFISGADEKLLRVFDEPKGVANSLERLCGIISTDKNALPDAANIPVLGLSNKAISNEPPPMDDDEIQAEERSIAPPKVESSDADVPPFEDYLARHLLWPEIEKLYGHGYEISSVAVSHDSLVVATACRASSLDHAVIRIYDAKTWREVKPPLTAHSLTVTSMEFSRDDHYLLSVGRDRQCAIFKRSTEQKTLYEMATANAKAHSRMILDAAWSSSEDQYVFATAGRDKTVKIWRIENDQLELLSTITTRLPVTTVAIAPSISLLEKSLLVVYGIEDGSIHLSILDSAFQLNSTVTVEQSIAPSTPITRLAWRPFLINQSDTLELAAASEDSSLRIYQIKF